MPLTEIREMKKYLKALKYQNAFAPLFEIECQVLAELEQDLEGIDRAEHPGTLVLRYYWANVENAAERLQLVRINIQRAEAWAAVWKATWHHQTGYLH